RTLSREMRKRSDFPDPGSPGASARRALRRRARSLRALSGQHDTDRFEQYDDVKKERVVLDVVEVVLELLHRILERRAVVVADLRPSGDAGLYAVADRVIRDFAGELVDEIGALGPWADEAHVAPQHVEELR